MSEESSPDSRTNAAEYSVSEISAALKRTVEDAFGNVRVRGEISGYRGPHSSGHAYFALKDERARIEAVVWRGTFARLKFKPEEGMEVIATGRLTTYPGSSKYQIVIEALEPAGAGALMALLEERKKRLAAEGLFAAERKRPLPFMPRVIGVVTSPTGAVIRDILHRIRDRYPLTVLVWPAKVQGETACDEVKAAVEGFNLFDGSFGLPRPDVLIVARGGGSLEDLWCFNDEALARAVAASQIPVVSAVGHETDWTLIDYVSDVRAPTPTGAAEMAVPVKAELEAAVAGLGARLRTCARRGLDRREQALKAAARALPSADQLLALPRRRFDEAEGRLGRALEAGVERRRARLAAARLSPATLSRRMEETRRLLGRDLARADAALRGLMRTRRAALAHGTARLSAEALARRMQVSADRLAGLERRADQGLARRLERLSARLSQAARLNSSLSHQSILERGFALVETASGTLVKRAAELAEGEALSLRFADGTASAVAGTKPAAEQPASGRTRPKAKAPQGQGSLF